MSPARRLTRCWPGSNRRLARRTRPARGRLCFRHRLGRTIAAGDYLKERHPALKIVAAEALQCPTLLMNGFGDHASKALAITCAWIHNVRNTDAIAAIDDEDCLRLLRLFNEPVGRECLASLGVGPIGEVLAAPASRASAPIGSHQDGEVFRAVRARGRLYGVYRFDGPLRLAPRRVARRAGRLPPEDALQDFAGPLAHQQTDYFKELSFRDRKALHFLKYYTWVEQQGKTARELDEQWEPEYGEACCKTRSLSSTG